MNSRTKRKFKTHSGRVFKIVLFTVHFQEKAKKILKVCLVGTLNLCLKAPKKTQKTRDESNYSRLRKRSKTAKKLQNQNLVICIFSGSLRHNFRLPTRHTLKIFFFFALSLKYTEKNVISKMLPV